jgi:hypothetical protein
MRLLKPGVKAVGDDIETCGNAGNKMTTINNLFDSFTFKLFGITLPLMGTSLEAISNDSEVSVKPLAIQNHCTSSPLYSIDKNAKLLYLKYNKLIFRIIRHVMPRS